VGTDDSRIWRPATRIAFRLSFLYLGSYILLTQLSTAFLRLIPWGYRDLGTSPPIQTVISWVARHLFGVTAPLVVTGSGSGDKTFDWALAFCLLASALLATAVWTLLDRRRRDYMRLHQWFRLFVRFALGATLVGYGAFKVFLLQMGAGPSLSRLIEPFGHFSPMGVLWSFIGASPAYQMFTGCAEILGGILLFVPWTATLGALVSLAVAIHVFTLNMTYDVPVKLMSFHLVLLALFLLAPESRRLANFFLLNRAVGPSAQPGLFQGRRAQRLAVAAQIAFGAYLLGTGLHGVSWAAAHYGGGAPKSLLYGIWEADPETAGAQVSFPVPGENFLWRRIIFDVATSMTVQRMDDTFDHYPVTVNPVDQSLIVSTRKSGGRDVVFRYLRPALDRLVLAGEGDGRSVEIQCRLLDRETFPLVIRGFHWIQEHPYNR
jgi:uncharacterized membrane protein